MKIIGYSLFGYGKATPQYCFNFHTYLRGLWINIRLARVLYPDWKIIVNTDHDTWNHYQDLFRMMEKFNVTFYGNEPAPLCEAMLWRMKPIWLEGVTHTICRDLDSPLTYREAQMVKEWIDSGKVIHSITDSISHNIYMLGGMIGMTKDFKNHFSDWQSMISGYNYEVKGSDQEMLCHKVYPKFAQSGYDSVMQHYILGMPNTFLSGYRNTWKDEPLPNVNEKYRQTNDTCGHIGAAGWYEAPTFKFLTEIDEYRNEYEELESKYKSIFYWNENK